MREGSQKIAVLVLIVLYALSIELAVSAGGLLGGITFTYLYYIFIPRLVYRIEYGYVPDHFDFKGETSDQNKKE